MKEIFTKVMCCSVIALPFALFYFLVILYLIHKCLYYIGELLWVMQ